MRVCPKCWSPRWEWKKGHMKKKKGEEKVAGHITEREMSMKSAFSPLIGRKREELY